MGQAKSRQKEATRKVLDAVKWVKAAACNHNSGYSETAAAAIERGREDLESARRILKGEKQAKLPNPDAHFLKSLKS